MYRATVAVLILVSVTIAALGLGGCSLVGDSDESGESNGAGVDADAVALGESIYQQQCSGCHANDDSNSVGPSFAGLYGSEVSFEDGSTTVVDDEYIIESVTDPQAKIREGFPGVMPSFNELGEDELAGIVAYIQSLE